jgi:hypothetical protein
MTESLSAGEESSATATRHFERERSRPVIGPPVAFILLTSPPSTIAPPAAAPSLPNNASLAPENNKTSIEEHKDTN